MADPSPHNHDSEELFHESESLSHTINEMQSSTRSLEDRIEDLESQSTDELNAFSRTLPNRQDIKQLSSTVTELVKMVGMLAEQAGYEVTIEDNLWIIDEAS